MLQTKTESRAFTLLEMLIVIVVVSIMAGMVLKLMSLSKHFQARAACTAIIERTSYALNEYRAEYGQYPPVEPKVCIGFENACHSDCRTCYTTAPGDGGSDAPDPGASDYIKTYGGKGTYIYGLVSYLIPRAKGNLFTSLPGFAAHVDTSRDEMVKRRWMTFLTNIVDGCENHDWHGRPTEGMSGSVGTLTVEYYVPQYTIRDPWWRVLRYRSSAPFSSYELWSAGQDTRDYDVEKGWTDPKYDKDNIHYKHGKWDG